MPHKKPHRPVDLAKQHAILLAAREEFFTVGFVAASIERIAQRADVSKVTIYNHYQGKDKLYAAVVEAECAKMRIALASGIGTAATFRDQLMGFGRSMIAFLSDEEILRFDRRISAEIERAPQLAGLFMEAGPNRLKAMLTEAMAQAMADGHIERADPAVAASHFFGLVRGFTEVEWRYGAVAGTVPDDAAIGGAVDRFLRAYALPRRR